MNQHTIVHAAACVTLAATIATACWAAVRAWRSGGVEALTDSVKPCPTCAPQPGPGLCLCVLDCGAAGCRGGVHSSDFGQWETEWRKAAGQ